MGVADEHVHLAADQRLEVGLDAATVGLDHAEQVRQGRRTGPAIPAGG